MKAGTQVGGSTGRPRESLYTRKVPIAWERRYSGFSYLWIAARMVVTGLFINEGGLHRVLVGGFVFGGELRGATRMGLVMVSSPHWYESAS
jgi:hypothetical protein